MEIRNSATIGRLASRTIGLLCVGLNVVAFGVYLASYFKWNAPLQTIVNINASMKSTWIYLLIGYLGIMLIAILLAKSGTRLIDVERWIQTIIVYLLFFGLVLFIGTAVAYPRHELNFDGQSMKVDDGKWMTISPPVAENVLEQNIRQDLSNFVFFMNIATAFLMSKLFAKSIENGTFRANPSTDSGKER
jgi:hypothetical protein